MLSRVFKLYQAAEKRWRRLRGSELVKDVLKRVKYIDGIEAEACTA